MDRGITSLKWSKLLRRFLKMLVVLEGSPGASPLEAVLDEEAVAEVLFGNLILERLAAIDVRTRGRRLDEQGAVLPSFYAGVVEGIDVDCHSQRVIRELLAALNRPIAIARGVVGLHGALVVVVVVGNGLYALDGVFRLVQGFEYFAQVVRNLPVTDNGSLLRLPLEIDMLHFQRVEHDALRLSIDANSQQSTDHCQNPLLHQLFFTLFFSLSIAFSRLSIGSMML